MKIIRNNLLRGTIILTVAGFLTRIMGFLYRIFLADTIGEHLLGIYQLIFPVYGICFTIYGAGIQTSISQLVASKKDKKFTILKYGLILSLTLSLSLSILVRHFAFEISKNFLFEPACCPYLKILSMLFPFCGISACINGYFYGKNTAKVPAISQMVEQIFRVFFVISICILLNGAKETDCKIAVLGVVVGEIAACIYNCISLIKETKKISFLSFKVRFERKILSKLFFLFSTLTTTKLILALLHSVEAIFIPAALKKYGMSAADALGTFGILTGISLPFILFPAAITNSFAVMLLPAIAKADGEKNKAQIKRYVSTSGKYSLLIGYLFTCIFLLFGKEFGIYFFNNTDAGSFIVILSWLCPFLYLTTTFTSVINGLGKTQFVFFITIASLLVKIYFLIALVPIYGIIAYLTGCLVSQIIMTLLELFYLKHFFSFSLKNDFFIPVSILLISGYISVFLYHMLPHTKNRWQETGILGIFCFAICLIYFIILTFRKIINKNDWS